MTASSETDSGDGSAGTEIDLERFDPSAYRSRTGIFRSSALGHAHVPEGLEWELLTHETDRGEVVPTEPTTNELSAIGMDWSTISISMEVTFPEWAHDLVAPRDEWSGRLGVVYWCRQTIIRDSSEWVPVDEPGTYTLSLEIEREDSHQSVGIQPALVRADSSGTDESYATLAGHRVAEGEPWTLRTDLPRSLSNLLQPETKSFSDDEALPGNDHLIFVDFDRDPPSLYLNADHDRIIAALDSDSHQGWDAAVRDVAYDTIEAEFWPQVILEAASDISDGEGPETPWKQGVLDKFREKIYGEGTSYEEAVDLFAADVSSPDRLPRLMQDIDDAIQTRNDNPSHLNTLLTLVDNRQ